MRRLPGLRRLRKRMQRLRGVAAAAACRGILPNLLDPRHVRFNCRAARGCRAQGVPTSSRRVADLTEHLGYEQGDRSVAELVKIRRWGNADRAA